MPTSKILNIAARSFLFTLAICATAVAQSQLFFIQYKFQDPKIQGINLDGTNAHELFALDPNEWLPVGLAYDSAAGKIYWTNGTFGSGTIRRSNLDGSDIELLLSGLHNPRGLAIDSIHGKLYYADAENATNNQIYLKSANLDGTGDQIIYTGSIYIGQPRVDATNSRVYFGADGEIKSAALDGSDVRIVVSGVSLPGSLDIDIANGYIYWIDFDLNADHVARARLDNTEFTVLHDNTPNTQESSGLVDTILDRTHGHVFIADQNFSASTTTIERMNLDGSNHMVFYPSDPTLTPAALALDVTPAQPIADCDGDSVSDAAEISQGAADCNENLIPDSCESNPCPNRTFLLDNGSNAANTSGFAFGQPSEWEQFQPFDVPPGGWQISEIGADGYTVVYADGSGFSSTLYPDNGANRPNLDAPIATATGFNFRFDTNHENWAYQTVSASLPEGRHWLRLHSNNPTVYWGSINRGTSGLGAFSRGTSGNYISSAFPLAVRLVQEVCNGHDGDVNRDNLTDGSDLQPFVAAVLSSSTEASEVCAADFSENGVVDVADVSGMVSELVGP